MFLLDKIRAWLSREKPPKHVHSDIPKALEEDIGVRITRIRLPSGKELVIVERVVDGES